MNKHRYTILRIKEMLKGYIFYLISFFIRSDKNSIVLNSTFNNTFTDNTKAYFEYLIDNMPDKKIFFIINNNSERDRLNDLYKGQYFITNYKLHHIIIILRSYYWFCATMELPLSGFFYYKRKKVVHFGHGMPYKCAGLSENQVPWYKTLYFNIITSNFTYSIATTAFFKPIIAKIYNLDLNKVELMPQPKTAWLSDTHQIKLSKISGMNVLYAPTWRPYAKTKLFPFIDYNSNILNNFLRENDITIWLRLHPDFNNDNSILGMLNNNIRLFSSNDFPDINKYLKSFDCLVTDYSSLYFDYSILNRPTIFLDYDLDDYIRNVGLVPDYKLIKLNTSTDTVDEFMSQLLCIKDNPNAYLNEIKRINELTAYPIHVDEINDKITEIIFSQRSK